MRLKHASLARKLQHVDMHGHDLATLDHVELPECLPGLSKGRGRPQDLGPCLCPGCVPARTLPRSAAPRFLVGERRIGSPTCLLGSHCGAYGDGSSVNAVEHPFASGLALKRVDRALQLVARAPSKC